ncbi:MAG: hypothetical protein CL479_09150 [Acidobacteria bacterium]|nr:hypothetical protein [Acidobacteriota bacterium]|tara:strand:+ start:70 stop:627 length:558 start_codon:yes stop_codon:yes gene_type:complete
MKRLNLIFAVALVSIGLTTIGCGGSNGDDASAPPAEEAAASALPTTPVASAGVEGEAEERPRFIAPIRGPADIAYLAPDTNVENGEVVTRIVLQNRATGAIAGLKVDEFWWDSDRNPLPGDSQRLRQPLMPGEVVEIELRVPRDNRMNQNQYSFSHANGEVNAQLVEDLPDPEPEEESENGETEG